MLRRLRDLLAHARVGHRIGCETCAVRGTYVSLGRGWMLEPFDPADRPWVSLDDDTASGEPVVAPAPARGIDTGLMATGSRPHTLYVADPGERIHLKDDADHSLGNRANDCDELPQGPVAHEHFWSQPNTVGIRFCAFCTGWTAEPSAVTQPLPAYMEGSYIAPADPPARSPVDAARERGEL